MSESDTPSQKKLAQVISEFQICERLFHIAILEQALKKARVSLKLAKSSDYTKEEFDQAIADIDRVLGVDE